MKTSYISGTFSPSLDGECEWVLQDGTGRNVGSGIVQDSQRTSIQVPIPAGSQGPFKLVIGPCQLAKVIDQVGGIVIVDTVMIHDRMPTNTVNQAKLTQEK